MTELEKFSQATLEIQALRALLSAVEWVQPTYNGSPACPYCDGQKHQGHRTDCLLEKSLASSATPRREFEDKPAAWLIVRCRGPRGGSGFHKEVVLSPLTDATFMDEGDEAWPLFRPVDMDAKSK